MRYNFIITVQESFLMVIILGLIQNLGVLFPMMSRIANARGYVLLMHEDMYSFLYRNEMLSNLLIKSIGE
jgi:hypothetical protein